MRRRTELEEALVGLGRELREAARHAVLRSGAAIPGEMGETDVQYGVDVATEVGLAERVAKWMAPWLPVRLLSEGLPSAGAVVGTGNPSLRIVIDPIDGTRGLMHDKRSAWVLLGVAPEGDPRLQTLEAVAMVEIPSSNGGAGEVLVASRGLGMTGSMDPMPGVSGVPLVLRRRPVAGTSLAHGFASVARFFPGVSRRLDAFTQELFTRLDGIGIAPFGEVFEDQYVSNGGQMAGLVMGRDRLVIDLRALLGEPDRPIRSGHPYDLLGNLVAEESGCVICNPLGDRLDAPLDLATRVPWVGYANRDLQAVIGPVVRDVLNDVLRRDFGR